MSKLPKDDGSTIIVHDSNNKNEPPLNHEDISLTVKVDEDEEKGSKKYHSTWIYISVAVISLIFLVFVTGLVLAWLDPLKLFTCDKNFP